jgi:hypothetical protein
LSASDYKSINQSINQPINQSIKSQPAGCIKHLPKGATTDRASSGTTHSA